MRNRSVSIPAYRRVMPPINSNRKGKSGERSLAKALTEALGPKCRRGQQYSGIEGQDVVGLDGIHCECKRTERLKLYDAIQQANDDAADGDVPVVFHRRNRKEWVCIIQLKNLSELARRIVEILDERDMDDEEDQHRQG